VIAALKEAGAIFAESNAAAATLAGIIAERSARAGYKEERR
jgi:hypothetical protein